MKRELEQKVWDLLTQIQSEMSVAKDYEKDVKGLSGQKSASAGYERSDALLQIDARMIHIRELTYKVQALIRGK